MSAREPQVVSGAAPEAPTPSHGRRRARRSRPIELSVGQRIGAWRVDGELGRGGMASVYAVTHQGFGKRAALKLCHPSILGAEFTAATFLREARIVHLVQHPGVSNVFATGTYDSRPYLVMERLPGETLGALLANGPLPRATALEILIELCDVLGAAHAAGVVHRDLKLDNIVVGEPGDGGRRVKLLDWGVAGIVGEPDPMRGMIAGTLTYVAPDQIRGDELTPAADVYSLAVLAYNLLLGAPPFTRPTDLALLQQHLHEPPPPPERAWPEIPGELADLLLAMLAKQPADRPSVRAIQQGMVRALVAVQRAARPSRWRTAANPVIQTLERPLRGLNGRQRLVGASIGLACLIASAASLFSA